MLAIVTAIAIVRLVINPCRREEDSPAVFGSSEPMKQVYQRYLDYLNRKLYLPDTEIPPTHPVSPVDQVEPGVSLTHDARELARLRAASP